MSDRIISNYDKLEDIPPDFNGIAKVGTSIFIGNGISLLEGTKSANVATVLSNSTPVTLTRETRLVPPGLPILPMELLGAADSWPIALPNDTITAAQQYHAAIYNSVNTYYVKPSTGSDANSGLTMALPFATVAQAMRTATGAGSRVVMLEDAVIEPFDLRASDPSQTTEQFKWLDANGFNVIIRDTGPDLTAQTWVVDGTYTNCYKTTLTLAGSSTLNRLLRTDQLDSEGLPKVVPKFASAALLDAALEGYYWDAAGKVLWINFGGSNVQHQRSVLKGIYIGSAGTSRVYVYGAKLGLSGVTLEGVQLTVQDNASYVTRRPEIWLYNCKVLWSPDKGADITQAGWCIASDTLFYSAKSDLLNAFAPSATGSGLVLTLRCKFSKGGDRDLVDINGTMQGTSAHGGSSHVGWGNVYELNNGQGIADTCANDKNDVTWLVGCIVNGQLVNVTNLSFGSAATNSSRKAYLDSCISRGSLVADLAIAANGTVYTYNCIIPIVSGGTTTPYIPNNPI